LFIWNNSDDAEGDDLTYNLLVDDSYTFNNPEINVSINENSSSTNTSYEITTALDVETMYFWKVIANDSSDFSDDSDIYNFTVDSLLSLTLLVDSVEFGSLNANDAVNTTERLPVPFVGENNGNIISNITITATPFFTSVGYPSLYYQFNISENESNSYNYTFSTQEWTNMTNVSSVIDVFNLNWLDAKDTFQTELLVTIPGDELAGSKNSTVTFTVS